MPSREHLRRFHFIREIASGGFGSVFLTKVMHADGFSRLVAVKLLKSQWSDSEEVARRMRDEARLLGLLRHRNIVDVIDLTSIDGRAAVIMEYLEAVDLRTVVLELARTGARLPVRAGLDIVSASASALDAAYNRPPIPGDKPLRVIHRDIKPSNVMVDDTGMVKVLDFGVARSEIDNRESHTQELQFGSVDYMAPERLFFEPETPASDVYSLAATLYELLALEKFGKARGRPARHLAYVTDRLSFLRGGLAISGALASELESLLADGLSFNHEDRPTAAEFHQRARALARQVGGDDLSVWAEAFLPPLIRAGQGEAKVENPLAGEVMVEDAKVFGGASEQPSAPSVGAADVLRKGALDEMEDTGAFVPSPPTGAPAQLRARAEPEPEPDSWDDGPTAVGGLTGPVRVPRPDNAEEVRRAMQARPASRGSQPPDPELPDPADPFAQLIRSPLSPRPEPRGRPDSTASDAPTEVGSPLREVELPAAVATGASGSFDPEAPEAGGPLPPLPAPPGVEARPLEPKLPSPEATAGEATVGEATAGDPTDDFDDDKTVPVIVPPSLRADRRSQPPSAAPGPSVPARPSGATIVPLDEDTDSEEEVTEMVGEAAAPAVPDLVRGSRTGDGIPVHGPPQPAFDGPPAVPVAAERPAVVAPPPPSLDEVVPQTHDSRYAMELAAAAEAERTEPSVAPIASVERIERVESAPSVAPSESAGDTVPAFAPSRGELHMVPDADSETADDDFYPPKKSKTPLLAAMGCFLALGLGGAVVGVGWSMGLGEQLASLTGSSEDAATVAAVDSESGRADVLADGSADGAEELAAATDTGSAAAEEVAEVPEGMVRFRVDLDGVRKLKVVCGSEKASGDTSASMPHGFEGDCAVTAILADRSRKTTRVAVPAAGGYICFSDGGDTCEAE